MRVSPVKINKKKKSQYLGKKGKLFTSKRNRSLTYYASDVVRRNDYVSVGSPDSEVIAKYLESFVYDPNRKSEVLSKYDRILR